MTKQKKILTSVLSIVLVAVLAIGGTLAYLFTKTDKKTNVFTFADNIKATLDEPNWDPKTAENLVPGKEIAKDPQITNTSKNAVNEYAAIKLTFTRGDGTALTDDETATLMGLITIDKSANWTLADGTATSGKQIYVYNDILNPNVTSDPIFYSIKINDGVTPEQLKWLAGDFGHDDTCYEFGAHDDSVCTITYKHHEKCAIYGLPGAENTAKGGTVDGKVCDCNPSVVHSPACPSLIATLKVDAAGNPLCGHTVLLSGIGNFNIEVDGAVVQADAFADVAAATPDLISLLA